ncbi:MAG TPA: AarF/UbiB family protein [Acidimicrobiales bacterium]|nr:AarF/UbiB family protein [Acidimicrobiales bacterium]
MTTGLDPLHTSPARSSILVDEAGPPRKKLARRAASIGRVAVGHGFRAVRTRDRLDLIRSAAEELGPSWVKVGQLVAASPGSFPPALADALRTLHDDVAPQPFDVISKILLEDLGRDYWRLDIDPRPVAAGSVAQVHRAVLDGEHDVAVKVQRAGILDTIDADLRLLRSGARAAIRVRPRLNALRLVEAIDDLRLGLAEELDFRREASNMVELTPVMAGWDIRVPSIHPGLCTERVVVMDWVDAVAVHDRETIAAFGADPEDVMRRVLGSLLESALVHGRFHADGHGGNVLVDRDGRVVIVDFGIVGSTDPADRPAIADMLAGVFSERFDRLALSITRLPSFAHASAEAGAALADVAQRHITGDLSTIKMGVLLREILEMAMEQGIPLPAELVLLFKQILYFDGLARALTPNFDLFADGRRYLPMLEEVAAGAVS